MDFRRKHITSRHDNRVRTLRLTRCYVFPRDCAQMPRGAVWEYEKDNSSWKTCPRDWCEALERLFQMFRDGTASSPYVLLEMNRSRFVCMYGFLLFIEVDSSDVSGDLFLCLFIHVFSLCDMHSSQTISHQLHCRLGALYSSAFGFISRIQAHMSQTCRSSSFSHTVSCSHSLTHTHTLLRMPVLPM